MAAPTVYTSAKQFVGLAKETTPGTAVAPTFTMLLEKFEPADKFTWLEDKSLRGSLAEQYGAQQGVAISEWSASGLWYGDACGYLLANILGDLTTTGTGPYTHAFSLLNSGTGQPGTLTWTDWQGPTPTTQARAYSGACLSELTLKGSPESTFVTFEAKGLAWLSAAAAALPTASPSAEAPVAAWRTSIGLGGPASGGTLVKTVGDWSVTLTRALKPVYTAQNSQNPYVIQRGTLGVTGSMSVAAPSDDTFLTYMLNNTQPVSQILVDNGGTTTASRKLQIDIAQTSFRDVKINRGAEQVAYDAPFTAEANTTNAGASGGSSPVKVTLTNNTTSGTY